MANKTIRIEIAKGQIHFQMQNFGKACDKEAEFLEELGELVSSVRDTAEFNRHIEKTRVKN